MSELSDDTLRKILEQIQAQALTSQKNLSLLSTQISSKTRERKILQLTLRELEQVPPTTVTSSASNGATGDGEGRMYKGVGKMFLQQDRGEVLRDHGKREGVLGEELVGLGKKAKYLEKQFEEANNQLKDIFHSQNRER